MPVIKRERVRNQAMTAIFLYGLVALFDGVSIGSGDFGHLPRTNFLAMVACVAALAMVRQAMRGAQGQGQGQGKD